LGVFCNFSKPFVSLNVIYFYLFKNKDMLQGSASIGILLLRVIGLLGALLGIASHFAVWTTIDAGGGKQVLLYGYQGLGMVGIGLLGVSAVLLLLNSVYAIVPLAFFLPYMLEQIIGLNLLRYMPLATTKLSPMLYAYLPTGFVWALLGSFAPMLGHIWQGKK
jgi:hypothetical protein